MPGSKTAIHISGTTFSLSSLSVPIMKWLIYTTLIVVFAACKKDNDGPSAGDNRLSTDNLVELAADIPDNQYMDLTFTSAVTGYALASAFIARTSDGGLSWDSIPLPVENTWTKIQFTDADHGYISGGDNTAAYLLKTVDAGQTWELIDLGTPDRAWGMHFVDNNTGFITGNGFFKKTSDGGYNWTDVRYQHHLYDDINFRNALVGYAASSNGVYFKTTDGGNTWDSLQFGQQSRFIQVHFTGSQVLMETAQDSVIDVANNFAVMKVPQPAEKFLFIDADHAIGVGSHYEGQGYFPWGDVFVTNNGWKTFKQKTYTTSFAIRFNCIARMSANKAMILGFGFEGTRVLVLEW